MARSVAAAEAEKREVLSEVNARIYEIALDLAGDWPDEGWGFICECGRERCTTAVPLSLVAYTALRQAGEPVLAPGHAVSPAELARAQPARPEPTPR